MISFEEMTFVPLKEPPREDELAATECLMPVAVLMYTYVDPHTGKPKYIREQFTDPETGRDTTVWSRVTDALGFVQQTSQ